MNRLTASASLTSLLKNLSVGRILSLIVPPLPENSFRNPGLSFVTPKIRLITTSLVINLLSLALPVLTLQVYDRLIVSNNVETLKVLAIGVFIVVILDSILRLCRSYVTTWTGTVHEHVLSCNALRHILGSNLIHLNRDGVGTHLQRMSNISKMREFMSGSALITLIDLPFIFVFLALITWLAGALVMVPIILLMIFTVIAMHIGKRLKTALEKREVQDCRRLDFIIESLEGIHSVKSLALEPFFQRRYEYIQNKTSASNLDLGRLNAEAVMVGTLFSQMMMISVIAVGAPMAISGSITMGTLIACVMLSARVTQPVQRALGLWTRYQNFRLSNRDVQKTFALPDLERIDPDLIGDNQGRVEIKDLSFSYGKSNNVILQDIDLDLYRGDSISISGPRGSGKTTLLKLVAGLYQPSRGEALIDGTPSSQYPARELVRHVGFLPMEGIIFRGTIWDNLSAFDEYSPEQVHEVAELLDLESSINKLPAGFDTKLEGSPSDPLPPGLRQRLAIARALIPKPRVILFDNADRALDREGYNTVYRLFARLKKKATFIIVSDDHNITRLADRAYYIESKTLVSNDLAGIGDRSFSSYQELRL